MDETIARILLALGLLAPQLAVIMMVGSPQRHITLIPLKHERVYYALDTAGRIQMLVYVIFGAQIPWTYVALPAAATITGGVVFALAGLWALWCRLALGRNLIPGAGYREGHTLTVRGPYKWIRHPMYASYFVVALGAGLAMGNWLVLALCLAAAICYTKFANVEENALRERLPRHAYHDYVTRTGKYFPSIGTILDNRRDPHTP